ncbi:hypothetical protein Ahia01_000364800 [Argonauta hians]
MEYNALDRSEIQHPTTDKSEIVYKPAKNVESETENTKKAEKVSIFKLFRYATCVDILLLIIGLLGATIEGVISVAGFIPFGLVIKTMSDSVVSVDMSLTKISNGLGVELGNLIKSLSATIASLTIGFVYQWKLSLVMLSITPVAGLAVAFAAKVAKDMTQKELDAYSGAGDVAEEVISSIRTVVAFGGETKECQRYEYLLGLAKKAGIIKGVVTGCSSGFSLFCLFCYYALGFWYGAKLIHEEGADISEILIAYFSLFIGGVAFGNSGPIMQHISEAQTAAYEMFGILDKAMKSKDKSFTVLTASLRRKSSIFLAGGCSGKQSNSAISDDDDDDDDTAVAAAAAAHDDDYNNDDDDDCIEVSNPILLIAAYFNYIIIFVMIFKV